MGSSSLGDELSSACEAQEEVERRKLEQDAHDAEEAAPPRKKKKSLPVRNEIHMKMRAVIDKESKWEKELEQVHGLAEEEVSMVMRIVTKHFNDDAFPNNFDPTATGGIDYYRALAKIGWQKMKECRAIMARYPREGSEQTCIHGVWKMIPAYDW